MKKIMIGMMMIVGFAFGQIQESSDFIKSEEGFKTAPYSDNTQRSVGHGTEINYVLSHTDWDGKSPLTKVQANEALNAKLMDGMRWLNRLEGFDYLPNSAKVALLSVWYNGPSMIGPKTRSYIKCGNLEKLSTEIAWGNDPKENHGLVKRRIREANLIRKEIGVKEFKTPKSVKEFQQVRWDYLIK